MVILKDFYRLRFNVLLKGNLTTSMAADGYVLRNRIVFNYHNALPHVHVFLVFAAVPSLSEAHQHHSFMHAKIIIFSSYFLYRFPRVNTWLSSEPKTCLSQKDPHLPSPCCSRLPLSFPTSTISPSPCPPPSLSPSPPFLLRTPKSPNSCHANWS